MSFGSPGRGTRLDIRIIENRFAQLMRKIREKGDLTAAQTLMTTILANVTAVNTYIQAASTIQALPTEQSITGSTDDILL